MRYLGVMVVWMLMRLWAVVMRWWPARAKALPGRWPGLRRRWRQVMLFRLAQLRPWMLRLRHLRRVRRTARRPCWPMMAGT